MYGSHIKLSVYLTKEIPLVKRLPFFTYKYCIIVFIQ
nr:MAG TPA: hypothetical protein [Caudoviricetes sp.]